MLGLEPHKNVADTFLRGKHQSALTDRVPTRDVGVNKRNLNFIVTKWINLNNKQSSATECKYFQMNQPNQITSMCWLLTRTNPSSALWAVYQKVVCARRLFELACGATDFKKFFNELVLRKLSTRSCCRLFQTWEECCWCQLMDVWETSCSSSGERHPPVACRVPLSQKIKSRNVLVTKDPLAMVVVDAKAERDWNSRKLDTTNTAKLKEVFDRNFRRA